MLSARLGAGLAWGLVGLGPDRTATRLTGNDTILAETDMDHCLGIGLFRSHACDSVVVADADVEVEHVGMPDRVGAQHLDRRAPE